MTTSVAKVGVKAGVWDSVLNASFAVQILLLVLIVLSVVSWGIIITKWSQFKKVEEANLSFSDRFWKATSLEAVYEKIAEFPESNLARVFKSAYLELQRIAESGLGKAASDVT